MKLLADDPKIYATEMKTTFGADVFQYALDSLGCGLAVTVLCNADWQSASGPIPATLLRVPILNPLLLTKELISRFTLIGSCFHYVCLTNSEVTWSPLAIYHKRDTECIEKVSK